MITRDKLVEKFSESAYSGDAAYFIGSGISKPYGLPDFKGLIEKLVKDVKIDLSVEDGLDYPEIAQYILNEREDKKWIFSKVKEYLGKVQYNISGSRYLDYISKSNIHTIWTTNFDTLIEQCFDQNGIKYDVKADDSDLKNNFQTKAKREIIKIHGSVDSDDIIITKNDYEDFNINSKLSVRRLEQDLLTKSILFIGYSYSDSDIQNIVNNVRQLIGDGSPLNHYMILSSRETDNEKKLQKLWINDLERYGIYAYVLENGYGELEEILKEISVKSKGKTVFVTGSHINTSTDFVKELGYELAGINGVTLNYGQSKGVGELACNSFGKRFVDDKKTVKQNIKIFPNPYTFYEEWDNQDFLLEDLRLMREELIEETRIMIAFPGEKGTKLEIEIAQKKGSIVIPVVFNDDNDFRTYLDKDTMVISELQSIDSEYYDKFIRGSVTVEDVIKCVRKLL